MRFRDFGLKHSVVRPSQLRALKPNCAPRTERILSVIAHRKSGARGESSIQNGGEWPIANEVNCSDSFPVVSLPNRLIRVTKRLEGRRSGVEPLPTLRRSCRSCRTAYAPQILGFYGSCARRCPAPTAFPRFLSSQRLVQPPQPTQIVATLI